MSVTASYRYCAACGDLHIGDCAYEVLNHVYGWDEMYAILENHIGEYARVTVRTGVGREAAHPTGLIGAWKDYLTLGGMLVGGEYSDATKIEVRGDNGRYQEVTE